MKYVHWKVYLVMKAMFCFLMWKICSCFFNRAIYKGGDIFSINFRFQSTYLHGDSQNFDWNNEQCINALHHCHFAPKTECQFTLLQLVVIKWFLYFLTKKSQIFQFMNTINLNLLYLMPAFKISHNNLFLTWTITFYLKKKKEN